MTNSRYKDTLMQNVYENFQRLAATADRALFTSTGSPNRGTPLGAAFWDGATGLTRSANVTPRALSAAAFAAGKQFAKKTKSK